MLKEILNPKLSGALHRFFNQEVDIQGATTTYGDYGEPIHTWKTILEGLKCRVAPKKDGEIQREDKSFVVASHEIIIDGDYEITEKNKAVFAGDDYEILLVKYDSERLCTYVSVRRVESEQG